MWISKSYGIAVFPLRNITWCFTTTLMIFSTWLPSGQSVWRFALCVAFDVAMALTGLAAAVQSGAPLWGCFSLSCICFAAMGYLQWQMVAETLKKCEDLPLAQNSLRRLRMILLVVWNVFGAVFVVQYTGAVSGKVSPSPRVERANLPGCMAGCMQAFPPMWRWFSFLCFIKSQVK